MSSLACDLHKIITKFHTALKPTMKLLQTSSFCGCTDLRTGGLIIGYLSLILDVFSFQFYSWLPLDILPYAFLFFSCFRWTVINDNFFNKFVFACNFSSGFCSDNTYDFWHSQSKSVSILQTISMSLLIGSKSDFLLHTNQHFCKCWPTFFKENLQKMLHSIEISVVFFIFCVFCGKFV